MLISSIRSLPKIRQGTSPQPVSVMLFGSYDLILVHYYWYWYTICQLNQSFSNSEAAMRSTMLSWHTVWPTLLLPAKWTQEKEKFTNIFLLWYTTVFKITQYLNVAHQRVCAVHVFFLKEIIKDFFTFIIWCHSSAATLLCLPEPWPRF